LLILWKIKGEWAEAKGEKFDFIGSMIYGIALIALMYGFSLLPEISGAVLTAVGILGLFAFIKWESRTKSPMLNIDIFRNNNIFVFSNMANLINYCATNAVVFLMSLYLQYIKALTPEQAGLILVAQPAMLVIFSPITGILSDRIEPRIVASSGMALTFIGLLVFSFLAETTSSVLIVAVLMIMGLGAALFITPNNNAIMGSVLPKYYAVASSTAATMRQVGQTLSLGITMIVMTIVIGRVAITPEHYPAFLTSTKIAFGIFAILCFGGIFFSLFRGKTR
jgi:MFS family permease